MNLPNTFILGPAKCGSSSIYGYLKQHPEIFMSVPKETKFFSSTDYKKGLAWYADQYFYKAEGYKIIGEATPYGTGGYALKRIHREFPQAKLIFCIRNPIERAFSDYCMGYAKGNERLTFKEALLANQKQRNELSFWEESTEMNLMEHKESVAKKNILSLRAYIDGSLYGEKLDYVFKHFSKEQTKIIMFDDLINDVQRVMMEIFDFLQVDKNFKINDLKNFNPYKESRLKYFRNIVGNNKVNQIAEKVPKGIKPFVRKILDRKAVKPKLTKEDYKFAHKYFEQDIEKLESLLSISFKEW